MWLGLVMIIAGRAGASWLTLGCSAAVTVLSLVVLQLNAIAARRHLRPRRDDLSRLLAEFDVSANSAR
jgi:membrane protein implicated in regulation of membrane protease activity